MSLTETQQEEAVLDCPICGFPRQHNSSEHRRQRKFFYDAFYTEDYVPGDSDESEDDEV